MQILDLVALLVFTYGAFVYAAMLVAWATAPRRLPWQGADTVGLVLSGLSAVWFVFHAASAVWPDGAWTHSSRLLAISLSVTMTFAYPPLIMHVTWVELDAGRRWRVPPVVRWMLPAMYVVAAAAVLVTLAELWGVFRTPRPTQDDVKTSVAALFIVCGLWSAWVSMRAGRAHESAKLARTQRVYAVLFVCMAVAFVLMLLAWKTILIGRAVEILVKSLPLVFLFAGTWVEDRLTFYDIFLKRGLTVFVTLFLFTGWFALTLPWLDSLGAGWWRPWAYALALLPLAVLVPALVRSGERWLDRAWFGREVSTFDAIARVLDAADDARDDQELRRRLEAAFSAAVNLPVRIDVGERVPPTGGQAGATLMPAPRGESAGGASGGVAGATAARVEAGGRGCRAVRSADGAAPDGLVVAIDGGEGPEWFVSVDAGDGSRALLSEDVARVRTLARVAGPLVRAMRVQQTVREHEGRTQQLALDARRAELRALRAQVDPHFLFNALNAVAGLVHVDADRADRTVEALAEVFRYTLRASEREWARVDEELAFAQAYLDVERSRFGDERLAASVTCEPAAAAVLVPALMIQTLVENAIKHGVAASRSRARVQVGVRIEGATVVVTVENDGPPPAPEVVAPAARGGHGLRNIRARLAGYYGSAASLALVHDGVTRAVLRLPLEPGIGVRPSSSAVSVEETPV